MLTIRVDIESKHDLIKREHSNLVKKRKKCVVRTRSTFYKKTESRRERNITIVKSFIRKKFMKL